ncbi:SusC/RagA family TonB-linked outer membrane protein [Solitalea lacus]|uniref:SusC/RagA family TonB-linked outer membrane protein n=1 Tax=Solitalea lacus TaxID=2911172 RepID=UPI001EDBC2C1|nr:SusC/RagA family TonB-linked outer membrane protein [Solitalea lacus]UKJ08553.1 SusC/RagA family TonB-linked outer membrane protein [Solitalea lacus]
MKKVYEKTIPISNTLKDSFKKASFLVLLLFAFSANMMAQSLPKVSLNVKGAQVSKVIAALKKQVKFHIVYNHEEVNVLPKVTMKVKDQPLEKVLEQILTGSNLEYTVQSNTVIIGPKQLRDDKASVVRKKLAISGVVVDEDKRPLYYASIGEIGSTNGTFTDANGHFELSVSENAVLSITYLGMIPLKVSVAGKTNFNNIVMKLNSVGIKEVVVSTGIFKKTDQSFTGASTTVTAKELQQFGNRNIITALRNIDPSFNIVESNVFGSNPNRLPEIQIRGNSSLPNVNDLQDQTRVGLNTPLIILDGFQSTLQKMLDINENEVESITILKDASATAIYGSRGANGVVVITTKAPAAGKLRINYRGDVNVEAPDLSAYSVLDARDKLALEEAVGLYNNARAENDVPLKRYYGFLLNEVNSGVNTYWLSKPLTTGVGQRHNIRLEGGDQTFRYSASMQLNDIKGVMKESGRKTYNGTINLSYTYKKVRFSNNLMIVDGNSANSPYGDFSEYVRMNPYWRAYDENGNVIKFLGNPGNQDYSNRWSTLPTNPLYNATLNVFDKTKNAELTNNTSIELPILQDLIVRGRVGITKGQSQTDKFRPAEHTAFANYTDIDIFRKGDYSYSVANSLSYDASVNLSYSKTFENNNTLFGGLDYNVRQSQASGYSFLAEGFTNANLDFISMAQQYAKDGKPTGSEGLSRAVGITGNINYIYDNRYFVDGSMRIDGSSQFGSKKRFAPFWSAGLGWNMHNENFLKNSKVINRLKIRGSFGLTGSQNFSSYQALSSYRYYTDDRYFNWNGSYLMGLGNEDLKWQQTMNYDIGIDGEFLDRRLKLTADYYIEKTNDLVSSVNLPASNGFTSYIENIGKMENRGLELKATAFLIRNMDRAFTWSVTMAMIHNKNKIVQISQALKDAQKAIENSTGAAPSTLYREGFSTNAIWVVPSLGIDPSTGKELYLGKDGLPTYTWSPANLEAVGSTEPVIRGNFSTMVRYKNLSLNAAFGYRTGGQLYNQTLIDKVENANYNYNVDSRVYDNRWKNPGDNAAFKGLLVTAATSRTSRFVQDEGTINCQNINLMYDLRSKYLNKHLGLDILSVSASVADAFYISTVRQERGTQYPFSRQFSLRISTTF